jgi:tripartite-type tricarboxylate transporter receptor subunit TctC
MRIRLLLATVGAVLAFVVHAQSYPSRPVRLVVPFPPGGAADIAARVVAAKVSERLGQQLVIENRGGGGGAIGTSQVAKSSPDGYTLLVVSTSHATLPAFEPQLSYSPERDFVPVAPLAYSPTMLVTRGESSLRSVRDLVAQAKANPGRLTCGSTGTADLSDLACRKIAQANGTQFTHVPFRGIGELIPAVTAGQIDFAIVPLPSAQAHVAAGRLRGLAVSSSRRASRLPDIPTFEESGLRNQEAVYWYGVVAPARTPAEIVERLNREFTQALKDPDVAQRLNQMNLTPYHGTSAEFAGLIREELIRWDPRQSGGTRTCGTPCPCTTACDTNNCCATMRPRPFQ